MNSFLEQYLPEEYLRATYKGVPYRKPEPAAQPVQEAPPVDHQSAGDSSNLYRNAGLGNLWKELRADKAFGGPGSPYTPEGEQFLQNNPVSLMDVGNSIVDAGRGALEAIQMGAGDALGAFTGLTQKQMDIVDPPQNLLNLETPPELPQKEITPSTTLADLKDIQVTAQKRQKVQTQNALVAEGAKGILKAGGSKEELKGWGKFSKEFDLQALGMALLATSGNGEGLLPNLGQALMFAKATRKEEEAEKAASAAAYRKEQRAYSKLEIDQFKALLEEQKAKAKEKTDAAGAYSDRMKAQAAGQTADAATVRANASMLNAQTGGTGGTSIPSNIKAYAKIGVSQAFPGMPENSVKALSEAISGDLAQEARLAKAAGVPFDLPARARELATKHSDMTKSDWFGLGDPYIPGID